MVLTGRLPVVQEEAAAWAATDRGGTKAPRGGGMARREGEHGEVPDRARPVARAVDGEEEAMMMRKT